MVIENNIHWLLKISQEFILKQKMIGYDVKVEE